MNMRIIMKTSLMCCCSVARQALTISVKWDLRRGSSALGGIVSMRMVRLTAFGRAGSEIGPFVTLALSKIRGRSPTD
jgi:hypothetical protein